MIAASAIAKWVIFICVACLGIAIQAVFFVAMFELSWKLGHW